MGDRSVAQNHVPVPIRLQSTRPLTRPGTIVSAGNVPRTQMVNQVYLLPKTGLVPANASQPSVMQVRSLATGQTISQTNGLVSGSVILPRPISAQPAPTSSAGVNKLVGFFNQLLELSKNVAVDTHSAVVRLIQALVNAELDTESFCSQLRANLKSENTAMDIGPFIKENIAALRKDLLTGTCRLPKIRPPSSELSFGSNSCVSVSSVVSLGGQLANTVQIRSVSPTVSTSAPRISVQSGFQPRFVGSPVVNSSSLPVLSCTNSASTASPARTQPHSHPLLLAPAPPRVPHPIVPNSASTTHPNIAPVSRFRLAQPVATVAAILPATASTAVVSTRFSNGSGAIIRPAYPNLRPVLASLGASTTVPVITAAGLRSCSTPISIPPPIAPATARTRMNSVSSANSSSLLPVGTRHNAHLTSSTGSLTSDSDRKQDLSALGVDDSSFISECSKDQPFFCPEKIKSILGEDRASLFTSEALVAVSQGIQTLMRSLLAQLSVVASHRTERLSDDSRLTQTDYTREQLQFLQRLDEHDQMRQSELEKDLILKAAKSRARNEDPDQIRMREMARRIASENYEREKQHQANMTALHAIGPQRKRRLEVLSDTGSLVVNDANTGSYSTSENVTGNGGVQNRLSLVTASRLGPPTSHVLSQPMSDALLSRPSTISVNALQPSGSTLVPTSESSTFSLTHSSRVLKVTLRDVQFVLSKSSKLRRTRTYFKTHWHA